MIVTCLNKYIVRPAAHLRSLEVYIRIWPGPKLVQLWFSHVYTLDRHHSACQDICSDCIGGSVRACHYSSLGCMHVVEKHRLE